MRLGNKVAIALGKESERGGMGKKEWAPGTLLGKRRAGKPRRCRENGKRGRMAREKAGTEKTGEKGRRTNCAEKSDYRARALSLSCRLIETVRMLTGARALDLSRLPSRSFDDDGLARRRGALAPLIVVAIIITASDASPLLRDAFGPGNLLPRPLLRPSLTSSPSLRTFR